MNSNKEALMKSLGISNKTFDPRLLVGAATLSFGPTGSTSATIGSRGGTLRLQSHSLEIPPGALDRDVNITMTSVAISSDTYPGMDPLASQVQLLPEGLVFKTPAKLTVNYSMSDDAPQIVKDMASVFYYNPETKELESSEVTFNYASKQMVANIPHFSIWAPLSISIQNIINGSQTNPAAISMAGVQFREFMRRYNTFGRRNAFYDLYSPYLLPFLNILRVANITLYNRFLSTNFSATPSSNSGFRLDDFDGDGINNQTDPFPLDPTNSGDVTPPVPIAFTPTGTSVTLVTAPFPGNPVTITFNEKVNEPSMRFGVYLDDGVNPSLLFYQGVDIAGTTATYYYPYTLRSDTTYTIRLYGITDIVGNRVANGTVVGTFKTEDKTLPTIVSVVPTNNSSVPASTSTISITFSEPMDPSSFGSLSIVGNGGPTLTFSGLDGTGRVASFGVSGLVDSGNYFLTLTSAGIKDISGNALAVTWEGFSFKTDDTTPPFAYAIDLPPSNVAITTTNIQVFFSEEVNVSSLTGKVQLIERDMNLNPVVTNTLVFLSLDSSRKIATYQLPVAYVLTQNTNYTVDVQTGVLDLAGNLSVTSPKFNFKTLDTVAPSIVNFSLLGMNNVVFAQSGVAFTVRFSEPMDYSSLATTTNVRGVVSGTGVQINANFISYDSQTFTATYLLPPSSFLPWDNFYYRTITMNFNFNSTIQDENGLPLPTNIGSYSFVTTNNRFAGEPSLTGYLTTSLGNLNDNSVLLVMNRSVQLGTLSNASFYGGYTYQTNQFSVCRDNAYQVPVQEPEWRSPLEHAQCFVNCDVGNLIGFSNPGCRDGCSQPKGYKIVWQPRYGCLYTRILAYASRNFVYLGGTYNGPNFRDNNPTAAWFHMADTFANFRNSIANDTRCLPNAVNVNCFPTQIESFQITNVNLSPILDFDNMSLIYTGLR